MPRLLLPPLLLLAACDWETAPDTCTDLPERQHVGACFGAPGLVDPGFGPVTHTVTGTVASITTGPRPDTCTTGFGGLPDAEAVILVVTDNEGVDTTVGLVVPGLVAPVAVGETVSLDLGYTFGEWGPDLGWAALTDAAGLDLVVVSTAGAVEDLRVPAGVHLDEGALRCTEVDECGTWSAFDLDVTTDAAAGSVPYGEQASVGPWRATHGGLEHQIPGSASTCPDWYVAHVSAAFTRE